MIKNGMHASKLGSLDKYSQIILVYNVTVILPLNPRPALIARITCTHVPTYNTIACQNSQLFSIPWYFVIAGCDCMRSCSSSRKLCRHRSSCYCFRVRGIVSVVCSIVLSKGCKPFMRDLTRAATSPYLWPDQKFETLFMNWLLNQNPDSDQRYNKFRKHNLWRAFVEFLFDNDEKVAS